MIQAKCMQKFRDKNNHIYRYRLQDQQGNIKGSELYIWLIRGKFNA